jgi:hypothetical protein
VNRILSVCSEAAHTQNATFLARKKFQAGQGIRLEDNKWDADDKK